MRAVKNDGNGKKPVLAEYLKQIRPHERYPQIILNQNPEFSLDRVYAEPQIRLPDELCINLHNWNAHNYEETRRVFRKLLDCCSQSEQIPLKKKNQGGAQCRNLLFVHPRPTWKKT